MRRFLIALGFLLAAVSVAVGQSSNPATTANGVVPVGSGGTGASTITGLVQGNGASAMSAYAGSGTCAASNWFTALSAAGAKTCSQPAQTDLSDYVATTWTPVLAGTSTAGTPTYTIQFGSYEKIGRQVTVRFNIAISAWSGTPAGNVTITGLPQTAGATANDNGVCVMSQFGGLTLTGNIAIGGNIQPSGTVINMVVATSASGAANMPVADWPTAAAASLQGSCSYHT